MEYTAVVISHIEVCLTYDCPSFCRSYLTSLNLTFLILKYLPIFPYLLKWLWSSMIYINSIIHVQISQSKNLASYPSTALSVLYFQVSHVSVWVFPARQLNFWDFGFVSLCIYDKQDHSINSLIIIIFKYYFIRM